MCFLIHSDWETRGWASTYIYGANSCYDLIELMPISFVFIIELSKKNPIDNCDGLCEDWSIYFSTEIDKVLEDIKDSRILNHRLSLLIPTFISNTDKFEVSRILQIHMIRKSEGENVFVFTCKTGNEYYTNQTIGANEERILIYDSDSPS